MLARRLKRLVVAMGFGVLSMPLLGASCNSAKKDPVTTAAAPADAPKSLRPDAAHAQEEDLPGVELGGLFGIGRDRQRVVLRFRKKRSRLTVPGVNDPFSAQRMPAEVGVHGTRGGTT